WSSDVCFPICAGLRSDPRRHDAVQGRVAEVVFRRLFATIPVLLLVTAGVFLLLHLTPGDPIDAMMAESGDAAAKESLRRELGLDRPLHVQYALWMGSEEGTSELQSRVDLVCRLLLEKNT